MADQGTGYWHRLLVVLALIARAASAHGGQVSAPLWPSSLRTEDRRAVTELARQVGLGELQRVWAYNTGHDDLCPGVRVESHPVVAGNRVRSQQLVMRRETGAACSTIAVPRQAVRFGGWLTVPAPIVIDRWRFTEGDWNVDVHLGPHVAYKDAQTVVHAIRRGQLVDRRSASHRSPPPLKIDPSRITRIDLMSPARRAERGRVFRVALSEGVWFELAIVGDMVELREQGDWAQ